MVDRNNRTPESARVKCKATAKSTNEQCGNWAVIGLEVCRMHGGSPNSPANAAKRQRAIEGAWTRALNGRLGVDLTPIEHLVDELHLSANVVAVLGMVVSGQAEDEEGRKGITHTVYTEGGSRQELSPEYAAWERERDRHARLAKMCLDAGVAERTVQLAEKQAEVLGNALRGILEDLGVADHPDAATVVRRHLSGLSATSRPVGALREAIPG